MTRPGSSKTVVLTGVTKGLGRAMAEELARRGHRVLGCGRSADALAQLRSLLGPPHDLDLVDVSQDEQVERWAKRLLAAHGAPDLVLNNAGLINRNAPLWQVPAEEVSRVVDVNLQGTVNVIRHFVPAMVRRRAGVIVNFSSGWGRTTDRDVAPYCATKWAIEGLSRALAQELPAGMAAVPLNPGIIDTDMLRSCFGPSAAEYPSPAAWAKTAVPFLLSLGPGHNGQPQTAPGG